MAIQEIAMTLAFAQPGKNDLPLHVVQSDDLDQWLGQQPDQMRNWVTSNGFTGAIGQGLMIPGPDGTPVAAVAGIGTAASRLRRRFSLAAALPALAEGNYVLSGDLPDTDRATEALGWLLSGYRFDRYKPNGKSVPALVTPEGIDAQHIEIMANSEALTRDLINTPTADMGPQDLETVTRALAVKFGANLIVTTGDALLERNFPLIHTVGRASAQAPRLLDLRWGATGPKLTLVGKGVCFDTGGLNLKPGGSMGLMKKDMGGAANVLGLAHAIMSLELPVQLRVLIPAVENAVSGNSFRPGDILTSRSGLTVEINNTDAEGRLVLADALTFAAEDQPDWTISMATLTGAARVAVGPDLAPFFTDDEDIASALAKAARPAADPVWRLPFWDPYETMIELGIADLDNAPAGGMAGAITAALFLRRFAGDVTRYTHFDIYGWQPKPEPGRSKGGLMQGPRAILAALPEVLGL